MIRNLGELGVTLQKIVTRLMNNQNLIKLLYYTDKDPLNKADLTDAQKKSDIYEKLIKIVPKVSEKETSNSIIAIRVINGTLNEENEEFRDITLGIEVFVPMTQWMIKDSNLRPFAILGEIQSSLDNKTINGIGKLRGGDFELSFLTEEIACYNTIYSFTNYD